MCLAASRYKNPILSSAFMSHGWLVQCRELETRIIVYLTVNHAVQGDRQVKSLGIKIQVKDMGHYVPAVPFTMLYKEVLT